jgi:uncharacterized membrane-anchored protein
MKKHLILGAFLVVALFQLTVPAWMIVRREITLREGELFKFRTAPVDPYDAFRGRYVALRIETEEEPPASTEQEQNTFMRGGIPIDPGANCPNGAKVYVAIEVGKDGFARLAKAYQQPPPSSPWVKAKVNYSCNDHVFLELPFDRYYMEESKAPAAEIAYNRLSSRNEIRNTWVNVRVRNGFAVLEELYLDGKPVREYLLENGDQGR